MKFRIPAYFIFALLLATGARRQYSRDLRRAEFLSWARVLDANLGGTQTPWNEYLALDDQASLQPAEFAAQFGLEPEGFATWERPEDTQPLEQFRSALGTLRPGAPPVAVAIGAATPAANVEYLLETLAEHGNDHVLLLFQGMKPGIEGEPLLDGPGWADRVPIPWGMDFHRSARFWETMGRVLAQCGQTLPVSITTPPSSPALVDRLLAEAFVDCPSIRSNETRHGLAFGKATVLLRGARSALVGLASPHSIGSQLVRVPSQESWQGFSKALLSSAQLGPVRLVTYDTRWTGP